jgi:hypothetical protein
LSNRKSAALAAAEAREVDGASTREWTI